MNKRIFVSAIVLIVLLAITPAFASKPIALPPQAQADLPEVAGIYDVPGEPNLKLRVFVYHQKPENKPAKPVPAEPKLICTLADNDSESVVSDAGWKLGTTTPTTWVYNLNTQSVPASVGPLNLSAITSDSFNEWLSVTELDGDVDVMEGPSTAVNKAQRDFKNIIAWGRTSNTALAVSYIWYRADTVPYTAVEVDTIMNQRVNWRWSNPDLWPEGGTCAYQGVYDAQNILTHELGHTFGLDDHYTSDYQDNTMYGYGSVTETKKNTLTVGDESGIRLIYGQ